MRKFFISILALTSINALVSCRSKKNSTFATDSVKSVNIISKRELTRFHHDSASVHADFKIDSIVILTHSIAHRDSQASPESRIVIHGIDLKANSSLRCADTVVASLRDTSAIRSAASSSSSESHSPSRSYSLILPVLIILLTVLLLKNLKKL